MDYFKEVKMSKVSDWGCRREKKKEEEKEKEEEEEEGEEES